MLSKDAKTVEQCYVELSKQVKEKLTAVDPYFTKLSEAMVTWIEAWGELNSPAKAGESFGPSKVGKKT